MIRRFIPASKHRVDQEHVYAAQRRCELNKKINKIKDDVVKDIRAIGNTAAACTDALINRVEALERGASTYDEKLSKQRHCEEFFRIKRALDELYKERKELDQRLSVIENRLVEHQCKLRDPQNPL